MGYTGYIPRDKDSERMSGYPWDIPGIYSAAWGLWKSLLHALLKRLASSTTKTIIVGDFNIHLDKKKRSSVPEEFSSLIASFGWIQHAEGPTHTDGHTLDLVISRA